ncbi:hypothetical protein [Pseudomonas sp. BW7P1]|uniref:hypothetical protein n=1 Tax=Pseudomonas TaxID=286 RepID=UPI0021AE0E93|nr:hypothetical protein [Pseudomonas sp. BW7P1]UWI60755.1 hypothetical protein NWV16_22075 [Pseudomonas sp. BW7P1]
MNSSSVTSQTWLQNFRPYVNGVKVRWPDLSLHLVAGQCIDLTLEFEYSYLIGDPESPLKLCCEQDAESLGLVCDPPFGQLVEMAEGLIELTWHICASGTSGGSFNLHFEMPLYQGMPPSPSIPGKLITIDQDLNVCFDNFPVEFGKSAAFPCFGAVHTITVLPAVNSALLGKEVRLKWIGPSPSQLNVMLTPSIGTSQTLTAEGCSWTLNCKQSKEKGEWALHVLVLDPALESVPLPMSLGHNLVTVERWSSETSGSGWPPLPHHQIIATSTFLKVPAEGVEVRVSAPNGTSYGYTDKDGKFSATGEGVFLGVRNKYNNSWV